MARRVQLPGIEPLRMTEIYIDDRDREVARVDYTYEDGEWQLEIEDGDVEDGVLRRMFYELHVTAVAQQPARAKARGFAMVQHPADVLNIDVLIEDIREGEAGAFSPFGQRNLYLVGVEVSI